MSPYLTIAEAAELLRMTPKTLRNKMAADCFVEGQHYFRPRGGRPLFKRAALEQWIQGGESPAPTAIRMAAGYRLGSGRAQALK